ncbi:MAG: DUF4301 family protein [Pseudomonadota bacterium]
MEDWKFNPADLRLMASLGISEDRVQEQISLFLRSSGYLRLIRPCTLNDGITRIPGTEIGPLIQSQEEAAQEGRFLKFVPASGAATRMFQAFLPFYLNRVSDHLDKPPPDLKRSDQKTAELVQFLTGINQFAFFEDLKRAMARDGLDIDTVTSQKQWLKILDYLLTEQGLNYLTLPKGLHKFHVYPTHNRTAFEEHLLEAVHTLCDRTRQCRLHVTVAPEHESAVRSFFDFILPGYENQYHCRLNLTFSCQRPSTNTLAVDLENRPFRDASGELLFRPGGHGALLENLNDLQGDLIYIKNVDNVLPDRLKEETIIWKKVLGGYLVKIQQTVHSLIKRIKTNKGTPDLLPEILTFCRDRLGVSEPPGFRKLSLKEQKSFLLNLLHRPIRVCGLVRNEGQPGGGPFWVQGNDGVVSRQIVESAQIDLSSAEQKTIWTSSTHFNPVDLVCAVRDYQGRPFDLRQFVDPEAVFITRKSQNGRELKALELPGLWNGSMAQWITLFVEVPNQTFGPVKTINDLLKPDHQP